MSSETVLIAKIGKKILSENTSRSVKVFGNEFFYENCNFKLLVEVDIRKVIKGSAYLLCAQKCHSNHCDSKL